MLLRGRDDAERVSSVVNGTSGFPPMVTVNYEAGSDISSGADRHLACSQGGPRRTGPSPAERRSLGFPAVAALSDLERRLVETAVAGGAGPGRRRARAAHQLFTLPGWVTKKLVVAGCSGRVRRR